MVLIQLDLYVLMSVYSMMMAFVTTVVQIPHSHFVKVGQTVQIVDQELMQTKINGLQRLKVGQIVMMILVLVPTQTLRHLMFL